MKLNSKQVVAAISVAILLVILIYPAISTSQISVSLRSTRIERADHVYLTVNGIWAHKKGQANSTIGWTLVSNQSHTIDLVSIVNASTSLGSGQVPVASYDVIRLDVSNVTWVFNKTTSQLTTSTPQLDARLEFTATAGKGSSIMLVLDGQQQVVGTAKIFAATINATLTEAS